MQVLLQQQATSVVIASDGEDDDEDDSILMAAAEKIEKESREAKELFHAGVSHTESPVAHPTQ